MCGKHLAVNPIKDKLVKVDTDDNDHYLLRLCFYIEVYMGL